MITYCKNKNHESKNKYKESKTITTILKTFDTFVIILTTSYSITLSLTGIGLIVIPISSATACGISIGNEVVFEIIINKYKKQHEEDQQTNELFGNFDRKSLQDNAIDKTEHESLCNIFTRYVDETKNESFL